MVGDDAGQTRQIQQPCLAQSLRAAAGVSLEPLQRAANHRSGKAAVIHDYLYATRGLGGRYSRGQADGIFREALGVLGAPAWKRALLWAAVRVCGRGGWGH